MTEIPFCEQCEQQHIASRHGTQACTGHLRSGEPCRNPPLTGQRVCRYHGGGSKQALAAAERRIAEAAAEAEARKLIPGVTEPIRDPIATLAMLAGEADAVRKVVARKVNELAEIRYEDNRGSEQLRAEVALYERFLDRTARICEALVKSNYLERHAAMEAAETATLLAAVQRGLRLVPDPILRDNIIQEISAGIRELDDAAQAMALG